MEDVMWSFGVCVVNFTLSFSFIVIAVRQSVLTEKRQKASISQNVRVGSAGASHLYHALPISWQSGYFSSSSRFVCC